MAGLSFGVALVTALPSVILLGLLPAVVSLASALSSALSVLAAVRARSCSAALSRRMPSFAWRVSVTLRL